MIKISIITITYNSENTLEGTIKSILEQNYNNLEYIIIDGGSSDSTLEIIDKYRKRIAYFISEPDNGISEAFNKGIRVAQGDVIGIINSDDMLYKDALFRINKKFTERPDLEAVHGNVLRFNGNEERGRVVKPNKNLKKLYYDFLIYHPSFFVSKKAYEKYGLYNCEYKCAMDYEFVSRMYFNGANIDYIDSIISYFRVGGTSELNKKITRYEHKKIMIQNGTHPVKAKLYMTYKICKNESIILIKKYHLEDFIRRTFQKPNYLEINRG